MEKSLPPFLCYPFAGGGYDIRTIQELVGHKDVSTTIKIVSGIPLCSTPDTILIVGFQN
jgi:hypothetical protein